MITKKKESSTKKKETKTTPKTDEETWWRVKLNVGIKTYGMGKTPEDAMNDVFEKVLKYPAVEEHIYLAKILKGKAEKPMSLDEMMKDPTNW